MSAPRTTSTPGRTPGSASRWPGRTTTATEVPGKPRVFMPYVGGVRGSRRILEKVVADGYTLRRAGADLQDT